MGRLTVGNERRGDKRSRSNESKIKSAIVVMELKQTRAFIESLKEIGIIQHRAARVDDELETHYLDLSVLGLRTSHFTPFVIPKRLAEHGQIDSNELRAVLKNYEKIGHPPNVNFSVLVIGGEFDPAVLPPLKELGERGIVILCKNDIEQIGKATDRPSKYKALGSCLREYLGLRALTPYIQGRPAFGGCFFGRKALLNRILSGSRGGNFTFIGNRRIGKTSLLREIKNRLSLKYGENETIHLAYVDGFLYENTFEVILGILEHLDGRSADHLRKDPSKINQFPMLISNMVDKKNWAVAVFIDEIDHILEFDKNFHLMGLLRSAFQHDSCWIYLAGFRKTIAAAQDVAHPLFNFTAIVNIGCLSREETHQMVTFPLTNLGIDIKDTDLPETVYRETSGHPDLVTTACDEIVNIVDSTGRVPSSNELLQHLSGGLFEQHVISTFLANTNNIEKLFVYLLAKEATQFQGGSENFTFRESDAYNLMLKQEIGIDFISLNQIMRHLLACSIIKGISDSRSWKFALPHLTRQMAVLDLNFLIKVTLDDIKRSLNQKVNVILEGEFDVSPRTHPLRQHVFVSYSHQDRKWLDQLQTHLAPLIRNREISVWVDTQIEPGQQWKDAIERAIKHAKVAILLVSHNFLASDFIAEHELPPLLKASASEGLKILWIPLTSCSYEETEIAQYQSAHPPTQPLDSLHGSSRNKALTDIVAKIRKTMEE